MNHIYLRILSVLTLLLAAVPSLQATDIKEGIYRVERQGFIALWGEAYLDNNPAASQVVLGENNEVFFKAVPKGEHPGYVKGEIEGDMIIVKLPQNVGTVVDEYSGKEITFVVDLLQRVESDGYIAYRSAAAESQVDFTIREDGSFFLDLRGYEDEGNDDMFPPLMLGVLSVYTEDDGGIPMWTGFGDSFADYTPNNEQPLALPEGLEAEDWVLSAEYDSYPVKVAIDNDNIYLGNLTKELPDSYVKGTIKNDKVTFPLTYMGYSETMNNFLYFVPCYWESFFYEPWGEEVEDYLIHKEFVFNYDARGKKLSNIEDYAAIMIGTSNKIGDMAGSYSDMYFEPAIMYLDPSHANAPLGDPEFLEAYHDELYDCDIVAFFLPSANQAGYPLDTERLSYIFYINDEPFTFNTEQYVGLEEDMTEIPFDFCDWENQDIWAYGQEHQAALYLEPGSINTMGLKMFYEKEDGSVLESKYVSISYESLMFPEGIQTTTAKPVSVEYYDLQGRATNDLHGLGLKVSRMADGSRRVEKILKK